MSQSVEERKKTLRTRLASGIIFLIGFLLVDEYIKEGYFFRPEDLFSWGISHETIIVGLVITFFALNRLIQTRLPR